MAPHLRPGLYADSVAVHLRPRWDSDEFYTFVLASSGDHREGRYYAAARAWGLSRAAAHRRFFHLGYAHGWRLGRHDRHPVVAYRRSARFAIRPDGTARAQSILRAPQPHRRRFELDLEPDLCMEVTLGGEAACYTGEQTFATAPSGISRWQLPAQVTWPDEAERRAIWKLQQHLHEPTTPDNLPQRVHLLQRWTDLLLLEGSNFGHEAGYWQQQTGTDNPEYAHRTFNRLLYAGDLPAACALLDSLLAHFDAFSRNWFADETPGNFHAEAWSPIISIERIRCDQREVLLECLTGKSPVTLHLHCPASGGLRLHAATTGLFAPEENYPLACTPSTTGVTIDAPALTITFAQQPPAILAMTKDGAAQWRIDCAQIAFRFAADGAILAVDLAGGLAAEEAIYGFGERCDTLNQRGRILTLWDLMPGPAICIACTTIPTNRYHSSTAPAAMPSSSTAPTAYGRTSGMRGWTAIA